VLQALSEQPVPCGTPVHVHVTDRLLGATPADAALLIEELAALHPLSVTLHDLPQPSDGPERFARRAAAYQRIATAAISVQVSSRHEQALLGAVAPAVQTVVVPLPVPARGAAVRSAAAAVRGAPTVGVLGYLYPGKGHAEVLAALDRLGRDEVGLVALGGPSVGHDWLVDDLRNRAGRRTLEITGYLEDDELDRRISAVTVPVVAPSHVSASGSLHRWIGCGRRPVTLANPYSREVAESLPGALILTDDLPSAIAAALQRPATTWRDALGHSGFAQLGTAAAAAAQSAAIRSAALRSAAFRPAALR
jgi:glycosyltransferase involved in cell wall biosynthesis